MPLARAVLWRRAGVIAVLRNNMTVGGTDLCWTAHAAYNIPLPILRLLVPLSELPRTRCLRARTPRSGCGSVLFFYTALFQPGHSIPHAVLPFLRAQHAHMPRSPPRSPFFFPYHTVPFTRVTNAIERVGMTLRPAHALNYLARVFTMSCTLLWWPFIFIAPCCFSYTH